MLKPVVAWCCSFLITMLTFSSILSAQTHESYYSLHQEPRALMYCSSKSCDEQNLTEDATCSIDENACPNGFRIVRNDIRGYKSQNDINDPKIVIGQEAWNGQELADDSRWLLPYIYSRYDGSFLKSDKTERFRVYIPPGTVSLRMLLDCPVRDYIAVAVRWKQPPCESCHEINSADDYIQFQFDRENSYSLSDLEERDYYLQNAGGMITIFSGGTVAITEGGWLYVYKVYSNRNGYALGIQYATFVNTGIYRDFFNSAQWDEHGDPLPSGATPSQYRLAVTPSGTGTGNVTSNTGGIVCSEAGGADCSRFFNSGTSVTLTAQAGDGSTFVGWGGDCGATNPACTLTMDGTKNVTAIFNRSDQPEYSITVTRRGTGSGLITSTPTGIDCGSLCYAAFNPNQQVTLTAMPANDSIFTGWGGNCSGTELSCSLTVSGRMSLTAGFQAADRSYTVTASAGENGSITQTIYEVAHGQRARIEVKPDSGYAPNIDTSGTCPRGVWIGNIYKTGSIERNCTVLFSFSPRSSHVVTAWPGHGGQISSESVVNVNHRKDASFAVKADDGFLPDSITGGNCPAGKWSKNRTLYTTNEIVEDCHVFISFSTAVSSQYSVYARLNDPNAGSIDAYERKVLIGQPVSFTVGPYMDYAIEGMRTTGGCGTGAWFDNTYTTTPTGDDCVLTFNLVPAAWYDLYRNWMMVPCLHHQDGTIDTYWRLLMKTPTGTPGTPPYLILDAIHPVAEADHGFTPPDCASLSLDNDLITLHIPCYSELYKSQCHEMEFILDADSAGQLIFQLQPRQDD